MGRLLLCGILGIALTGCHGKVDVRVERNRRAAESSDVVIGVAWPWKANPEILYWQGLQLALEEINNEGGVTGRPVKLLRADDDESIDEGRVVALRFARNPNVVAVIGHLQSYVTLPAAAIYDLYGLPLVAATVTAPELTGRGYHRTFRTIFTDSSVGRQMAEFGIRRGYQRMVIYYSRDAYGRGLANAFEETATRDGARILDRRSYDPGLPTNALSAEQAAEAWQGLDANAVFIAGRDYQGGLLAKKLRERGIKAAILGGDALGTAKYLDVGGSATEGTVVATPFVPDAPGPEAKRFTTAFRKKYGRDPDVGAALGYDALRVLCYAMNQAHSTAPADIAAAMRRVHAWPGVTGRMTFNKNGDLTNPAVMKMVVRNGRFRYLADSTDVP